MAKNWSNIIVRLSASRRGSRRHLFRRVRVSENAEPTALSPDGKVLMVGLPKKGSDYVYGALFVWHPHFPEGRIRWSRRIGLYWEYPPYARAVWSEPLQAVAVSFAGATDGESCRTLTILTRTREMDYRTSLFALPTQLLSDPVWLGNRVIFAEGGWDDIEAADRMWRSVISSLEVPRGRHQVLFAGADDYRAPAVSPDNGRLAYAEKRGGQWEVVVVAVKDRPRTSRPAAPRFLEKRDMRIEPDIAFVATLLSNSARAAMCLALADGRAIPAGELARRAHISAQTASNHLAQLAEAGIVRVEQQGRWRYYRLANAEVAHAVEALAVVAPRPDCTSDEENEAWQELRDARTCYRHLAGRLGVAIADALLREEWIAEEQGGYQVTPKGASRLRELGVDLEALRPRNGTLVRRCIDWTERRPHLAGPLGTALADLAFTRDWVRRRKETRAVLLTPFGQSEMERLLRVRLS
jgi:DNA-binding transcriptional ArsR family regulator